MTARVPPRCLSARLTVAPPALAQNATARKVTLDLNGVCQPRVQGVADAIGVSVTVEAAVTDPVDNHRGGSGTCRPKPRSTPSAEHRLPVDAHGQHAGRQAGGGG